MPVRFDTRPGHLWPWLLAALAWAPAVAADEAGTDAATAEALFQVGKARMAAHDYAAACPKLAESNRLDPGTGILLALAICHEEWGKTASAWAEFTEVATEAPKENRPDRESFAKQHIATLAPGLSRLTLEVPKEATAIPGLEVKRDGVAVGNAAWGMPVPIDPGGHRIEVSAPGHSTWRATVDVTAWGSRQSLTVGLPQPEPSLAADVRLPPSSPSTASGPANGKRVVGYGAGAVGIIGIGLGTYFGVETIVKNNDAKALCTPPRCANSAAVSDSSAARTFADLADIGFGVGIIGLGTMAYILLTLRSASAPRTAALHLAPLGGPSFAGVSVERSF